MNFLKQVGLSVRSNPFFVSAYSIFVGALATQIQSDCSSGHLDWSLSGWEHMVEAAASLTIWTLVHIYLPAPGTPPNAAK